MRTENSKESNLGLMHKVSHQSQTVMESWCWKHWGGGQPEAGRGEGSRVWLRREELAQALCVSSGVCWNGNQMWAEPSPVCTPTSREQMSTFSTSMSLGIMCSFGLNHSDWGNMKGQSGLNLCFPDG